MQHHIEKVKQFFREHDDFAKHNGMELLEVKPGYALAQMNILKCHLNGLKTVHGGAIFALADYAFAAASNTHGRQAMTVNAGITFVKAVSEGTLVAEAKEIALNYKMASYLVQVTNQRNEVVAILQGSVYRKESPFPAK